MRFSRVIAASIVLSAPSYSLAQDDAAATEADTEVQPEPAAAAPATVWLEDDGCLKKMTADFTTGIGQPSARLDPQQAVYTPAGLTALGNPVAYVIVARSGAGPDAAVRRLFFRLAEINNAWGSDYRQPLRAAFDKAFDLDACDDGASCVMGVNDPAPGDLSGAELSNRMPAIPPGAEGSAMPLLEADYDLEGADPVFLVCNYAER